MLHLGVSELSMPVFVEMYFTAICSFCFQKKDANIKIIPAFKPIPSENATPDTTPEKLSIVKTEKDKETKVTISPQNSDHSATANVYTYQLQWFSIPSVKFYCQCTSVSEIITLLSTSIKLLL